MRLPVRIREEADVDLSDAAIWYEQQRIGLGQEFLDQAQSVLDSLPDHPNLYPVVHNPIRRALLSRFPFGVFYSVEREYILVYAVMHARRHPRRWQERT
jgi:plasmid stabilization system protein ParE